MITDAQLAIIEKTGSSDAQDMARELTAARRFIKSVKNWIDGHDEEKFGTLGIPIEVWEAEEVYNQTIE